MTTDRASGFRHLYKSFFDNTLNAVAYCRVVLDSKGSPVDFVCIAVNKNFEKLTGLRAVAGKRASVILPGIIEGNPALVETLGNVALTGRPERLETRLEPISRWLLISAYSPRKRFVVVVFENITNRKHTEQDLEHAKIAARNVLEDLQTEKEELAYRTAKDEAMLASIGDGVIIVDLAGTITFANKSAQDMLGWDEAEMTGKPFVEVVQIEEEKADSTSYYVRKDKSRFPVAITMAPVILADKKIGTIEVFRDNTKEKEIDRAKTEFVSLASHQLRTPLSAVRWYSEMLLDGDAGAFNEKQKKYLEEIQRGNLRMIELVNTLLDISRHELGTVSIRLENVSISTVVSDVLKDLELRRRARAISVEVDVPKVLPLLMTDAKLVRIIVENLLSNAIKYTGVDGVVKVVVEEISAGGLFDTRKAHKASIGFSVSDTGIGIPKVAYDGIFKKLFRAENVRELDTDGAGLGLYLTKLVLKQLDGEIWFTSNVSKGTTFYVLIPLSA